jgi:hypothetical protein
LVWRKCHCLIPEEWVMAVQPFGMEEMPLPNSRRLSHGGTNITLCTEEMPLPNSRSLSHGGTTITLGMKEMPLPNSRQQSWWYNHCISCGENFTTYFQKKAITFSVEEMPLKKFKLNNLSSGLILSLFVQCVESHVQAAQLNLIYTI